MPAKISSRTQNPNVKPNNNNDDNDEDYSIYINNTQEQDSSSAITQTDQADPPRRSFEPLWNSESRFGRPEPIASGTSGTLEVPDPLGSNSSGSSGSSGTSGTIGSSETSNIPKQNLAEPNVSISVTPKDPKSDPTKQVSEQPISTNSVDSKNELKKVYFHGTNIEKNSSIQITTGERTFIANDTKSDPITGVPVDDGVVEVELNLKELSGPISVVVTNHNAPDFEFELNPDPTGSSGFPQASSPVTPSGNFDAKASPPDSIKLSEKDGALIVEANLGEKEVNYLLNDFLEGDLIGNKADNPALNKSNEGLKDQLENQLPVSADTMSYLWQQVNTRRKDAINLAITKADNVINTLRQTSTLIVTTAHSSDDPKVIAKENADVLQQVNGAVKTLKSEYGDLTLAIKDAINMGVDPIELQKKLSKNRNGNPENLIDEIQKSSDKLFNNVAGILEENNKIYDEATLNKWDEDAKNNVINGVLMGLEVASSLTSFGLGVAKIPIAFKKAAEARRKLAESEALSRLAKTEFGPKLVSDAMADKFSPAALKDIKSLIEKSDTATLIEILENNPTETTNFWKVITQSAGINGGIVAENLSVSDRNLEIAKFIQTTFLDQSKTGTSSSIRGGSIKKSGDYTDHLNDASVNRDQTDFNGVLDSSGDYSDLIKGPGYERLSTVQTAIAVQQIIDNPNNADVVPGSQSVTYAGNAMDSDFGYFASFSPTVGHLEAVQRNLLKASELNKNANPGERYFVVDERFARGALRHPILSTKIVKVNNWSFPIDDKTPLHVGNNPQIYYPINGHFSSYGVARDQPNLKVGSKHVGVLELQYSRYWDEATDPLTNGGSFSGSKSATAPKRQLYSFDRKDSDMKDFWLLNGNLFYSGVATRGLQYQFGYT
jgi:hypothetical protein